MGRWSSRTAPIVVRRYNSALSAKSAIDPQVRGWRRRTEKPKLAAVSRPVRQHPTQATGLSGNGYGNEGLIRKTISMDNGGAGGCRSGIPPWTGRHSQSPEKTLISVCVRRVNCSQRSRCQPDRIGKPLDISHEKRPISHANTV